jgi:signal transduction histidine kinase
VNLSVRRLPIRTRLALIYTGLLVAALAVFGTGVFLVLRAQLQSSFDVGLMANAEHAAGAFAQDVGTDGRLHPTARLLNQFASTGGRVEILDSTGKLVLDSAAPGSPPLEVPIGDISTRTHSQDVHAVIAGDERLRLVVEPIAATGQSVAGYVVWAASTRDSDDLLRTVALVLVLGGLLLTALAFGVGSLLARRALAPVSDVTDTARAISLSGDFGARVEAAGSGGDEVSELAVAFNEMLAALEENHQALQRFLGDASHELRTPLTTLRASLDLAGRPALPAEEREALLADARSGCRRGRPRPPQGALSDCARQRREIHTGRWNRNGEPDPERSVGQGRGVRHWHRHPGGRPRPCLRAPLSRLGRALVAPCRHGAWPGDRKMDRRVACGLDRRLAQTRGRRGRLY